MLSTRYQDWYNVQQTLHHKGKERCQSKLELTDLIGDIYVHEIVKFIDSIKLGENSVNFDTNLSTTEMIEIFESLPLSVSSKVTEGIQKVRNVEIKSTESPDMPENSTISIDASIFTSE